MFTSMGGETDGSGTATVGENFEATPGVAVPRDVVLSWFEQRLSYNFAENTCSSICGFYTQVRFMKIIKTIVIKIILGREKGNSKSNMKMTGHFM